LVGHADKEPHRHRSADLSEWFRGPFFVPPPRVCMVYGHTLCVYVYRPTPLINLRERRRWGWEWRKWKRTRNGHDETDRRTDERMDGWAKRTKKQARFEGGQGRLTEAEGGGVEEWRGAAPKLRDYVLSITARTHIHPPQHPQIPPPPIQIAS